MTPIRPFRAPLIAPHRPDDHELWPMQASIDESLLRAEEESEVPAKKILPSSTLVYNDEWEIITKYTMMLAGLMLDVSAVMSALVAVIVQCFTFERRLCGRPCRWRLSRRDDVWERACGAPCGRSCSHRADVPHCCPQHGTRDEETLIERMIHQWVLVRDAGVVAWKRAKATWASWWAIKAMIALLIAKLTMAHSTPTLPTSPLLPEPVYMLTLESGYHKQAYVYAGSRPELATFDSGSYRNAISEKFLMMLEERGSKAITSRQACTPTDVSGVLGSVATQYHEVVGLTITFRESETRDETIKLFCVVLPDMGTELIIGCPTLDTLGYASSKERIELRGLNLELPSVLPTDPATNPIAVLTGPMVIQPGELRELWLPANAKPNQSCMVKPSSKMRPSLVIAEGPAKIENGKVKVYLTTEGDEA